MVDEIKIMQLADGTLPMDERAEVEKAIKNDPKLKKLFEDYQKSADLLFELGSEVKKSEVPSHILDKLKSLKIEKKIHTEKNFNLFSFFKFQYAGVAAAIAIVFGAGFTTSNIITKNNNSENQIVSLNKKMDFKFRGEMKGNDEDLSERIASVYRLIDENKITSEFNKIQSNLKIGDYFGLGVNDALGNETNFVLTEIKKISDYNCKIIAYDKKVILSENDKGSIVKLVFCEIDGSYKISSIEFI